MTRRLILKNSSLSGRLSICTGAQCVLSRKLILTFEILTNFASADSSGNGNSFSHSGFRRWWCSDSGNGNRQTGYRNRVGRGLCGMFGAGTYCSLLTVLPRQSVTGSGGNRNPRIRFWEPCRSVVYGCSKSGTGTWLLPGKNHLAEAVLQGIRTDVFNVSAPIGP
jgi:hypothetical protein